MGVMPLSERTFTLIKPSDTPVKVLVDNFVRVLDEPGAYGVADEHEEARPGHDVGPMSIPVFRSIMSYSPHYHANMIDLLQ